jgi:hypothetical protein
LNCHYKKQSRQFKGAAPNKPPNIKDKRSFHMKEPPSKKKLLARFNKSKGQQLSLTNANI